MTDWNINGARAAARCRGYDLEAWWGTGRDYDRTAAERESATPENGRPAQTDEGIIIRVRSKPRGVDNLSMMVILREETAPEGIIGEFTRETEPESLLPQYSDWIEEWNWIAGYRGRARWKRIGNQATAFIGPLTLTVKMTTMGEAIRRIEDAAEPDTLYAANRDMGELAEAESGTPVFMAELREDLKVIASRITRAADEEIGSLREYTRVKDPAIVVTACLAEIYEGGVGGGEAGEIGPEAGPEGGPGSEEEHEARGGILFRDGRIINWCEHNDRFVCSRCVLREAHTALGEALDRTPAPTENVDRVLEENLGRIMIESLACIEDHTHYLDFHAMAIIAAIKTGHHECACAQCLNWEKWRAGGGFEEPRSYYNPDAIPMQIDLPERPGNPGQDGE